MVHETESAISCEYNIMENNTYPSVTVEKSGEYYCALPASGDLTAGCFKSTTTSEFMHVCVLFTECCNVYHNYEGVVVVW